MVVLGGGGAVSYERGTPVQVMLKWAVQSGLTVIPVHPPHLICQPRDRSPKP